MCRVGVDVRPMPSHSLGDESTIHWPTRIAQHYDNGGPSMQVYLLRHYIQPNIRCMISSALSDTVEETLGHVNN